MVRAVGVRQYGGPERLEVVDVALEPLGPGQVRIRVTAAAVSPTDTLLRSGARADGAPPAGVADVPGMDAAGEVVEVGPGTDTDLVPGDRVMAIVVPAAEHGAYRSDLVVPLGSVARVPAGASDVEAATLPMNALTARLALDTMALAPGDVLAVTGAAGAFGGYVVQLAKADGLTVVADATESDEALVRQLGADVVVRRGDDVAARIREQFVDGVDGLADGSVQVDALLPAVRSGGVMSTIRGWRPDEVGDVRVEPVMVRDVAERHDLLDGLRAQVESGAVTLRVAGTVPADDAAWAHRRLEAGGVRGRLVITFD